MFGTRFTAVFQIMFKCTLFKGQEAYCFLLSSKLTLEDVKQYIVLMTVVTCFLTTIRSNDSLQKN